MVTSVSTRSSVSTSVAKRNVPSTPIVLTSVVRTPSTVTAIPAGMWTRLPASGAAPPDHVEAAVQSPLAAELVDRVRNTLVEPLDRYEQAQQRLLDVLFAEGR